MAVLDLKRRLDWAPRLNEFMVKAQTKKFKWGTWDCALGFGGGAVKALTGVDVVKDYRKKYNTKDGADVALQEIGAGTLYKTLRSMFGNPVPAVQAHRGDICFHNGMIGVIYGPWVLFLTEERGFHREKIQFVKRAFRIKF